MKPIPSAWRAHAPGRGGTLRAANRAESGPKSQPPQALGKSRGSPLGRGASMAHDLLMQGVQPKMHKTGSSLASVVAGFPNRILLMAHFTEPVTPTSIGCVPGTSGSQWTVKDGPPLAFLAAFWCGERSCPPWRKRDCGTHRTATSWIRGTMGRQATFPSNPVKTGNIIRKPRQKPGVVARVIDPGSR